VTHSILSTLVDGDKPESVTASADKP